MRNPSPRPGVYTGVVRILCKFLLLVTLLSMLSSAQQNTTPIRIICKPPKTKIVKIVRPRVSPDAKHIFGKVLLRVVVDKEGKPSSVKVLQGQPILAAAVLDAVKQWRWRPLVLNGVAVEMETTLTVQFEPR